MYASALPRESRSSEICVKINRKPEKHPQHIIDRTLNKDKQILIIFVRNISNTRVWSNNTRKNPRLAQHKNVNRIELDLSLSIFSFACKLNLKVTCITRERTEDEL